MDDTDSPVAGMWSGYELCRVHGKRRPLVLRLWSDGARLYGRGSVGAGPRTDVPITVEGTYEPETGRLLLKYSGKHGVQEWDGRHERNTIYGSFGPPTPCYGGFKLTRGVNAEDVADEREEARPEPAHKRTVVGARRCGLAK